MSPLCAGPQLHAYIFIAFYQTLGLCMLSDRQVYAYHQALGPMIVTTPLEESHSSRLSMVWS